MKTFTFLLAIVALTIPEVSSAQAVYSNLISIPGVDTNSSFGGYINALYLLSISVAAILAVVKIIIGGVKYMLTDIVTSKADAKNEIKGALLGLLLIISAVLILTVINSNIVDNQVSFKQVTLSSPNNQSSPAAQNNSGIQPVQQNNQGVGNNSPLTTASATCQNKVDTEYANVAPQTKQFQYNACMTLASGKLQSDCTNAYGIYDQSSGSCQKPTTIRPMSDFSAEFEAYKASLPATDYAGKGAATMSLSVEKKLCTNWGGTFYDNWGPANTCLKY